MKCEKTHKYEPYMAIRGFIHFEDVIVAKCSICGHCIFTLHNRLCSYDDKNPNEFRDKWMEVNLNATDNSDNIILITNQDDFIKNSDKVISWYKVFYIEGTDVDKVKERFKNLFDEENKLVPYIE